jgi:hypothetical protein
LAPIISRIFKKPIRVGFKPTFSKIMWLFFARMVANIKNAADEKSHVI